MAMTAGAMIYVYESGLLEYLETLSILEKREQHGKLEELGFWALYGVRACKA